MLQLYMRILQSLKRLKRPAQILIDEHWGGETPLHWTVRYRKSDMVPALTEGANIDARDKLKGWTALRFAARDGDVHIVEALVAGANVSARDPNDCISVHVAAACRRSPAFLLLSRYCYNEVWTNDCLSPTETS